MITAGSQSEDSLSAAFEQSSGTQGGGLIEAKCGVH